MAGRTYLFEPAASGRTAGLTDAAPRVKPLELLQQRLLLSSWKHAICEMARARRGAAPPGRARAMRPDTEVAKDDVKAMRQFRTDALHALPGFFKKLTGAYEYRVFWFEVSACAADRCI